MTSQCPHCEGSQFTVSVPSDLSTYTSAPAISCCQRCLSVEAGEPTEVTAEPPFESIHQRFPTGTAGVALLLLLDNLTSLALNRAAIESLVEFLETNGVDLFLTLERLIESPEINPKIDLARRHTQLEQILSE